jgi:hemerythrin superfamily protein
MPEEWGDMTTSTRDQDVVDILTTDHHEVLDLVGRIPGADPAQRRDMADTVIAELMRHSVAEEMYVYPAMRDHLPDGERQVQHDVEEHQQLTEVMKDLEDVDAADPRFLETLGRLETVLRDHVTDEERDQFPQLRSALPREQLVEIGAKVEAAKKAAPTRPHPSAPHSELFHKTVGPGVGLVDRLRDKLTGRPNKA